jgi:hypothetical protein
MKYFIISVFVGLLFFACQKEIHFAGGSGGGNNPPPSSVRCTGCSYLPVCDSTTVTYIDSTATGVDTTESILMILGDTTINGRKFNRVTPSSVFPQGLLYNCDGGDYRIYQPVPDLGIDIDSLIQSLGLPIGTVPIPSRIQTTILKSGVNAGASWSDTVFQFMPLPLFNVVAKLDYKLEAKGIQRTILGKVFNNVIHVSSKLNLVIPLISFPVDVSINYYFADGVGIIESITTESGVVQSRSQLWQYKIK